MENGEFEYPDHGLSPNDLHTSCQVRLWMLATAGEALHPFFPGIGTAHVLSRAHSETDIFAWLGIQTRPNCIPGDKGLASSIWAIVSVVQHS
eukprot:s242_g40.t1